MHDPYTAPGSFVSHPSRDERWWWLRYFVCTVYLIPSVFTAYVAIVAVSEICRSILNGEFPATNGIAALIFLVSCTTTAFFLFLRLRLAVALAALAASWPVSQIWLNPPFTVIHYGLFVVLLIGLAYCWQVTRRQPFG